MVFFKEKNYQLINFQEKINFIVNLLRDKDNILIITHKNPDGDAIGSCFGLYYSLIKLGKKVAVDIGNMIPDVYNWICNDYHKQDFSPGFIVSVDLADPKLLLDHLKVFEGSIDLAIDHHPSNTLYANYTLLDDKSAATAQVLYDVVEKLLRNNGFELDEKIASCLYLGLATDTGCFKYSSVTPKTHRIAADLIERGANYFYINKKMFDSKSKQKLLLEQKVLSGIEYYFGDRCAIIFISKLLREQFKVDEEELEGFSVLPMQIEGVEIGVTIKEKDKEFKVSIRTNEKYDASEICRCFGGGGHKRAGGCMLKGNFEDVKKQLMLTISEFL